jgi:uncharacterized protein YdhG (YjbR/CyaY superfamily)
MATTDFESVDAYIAAQAPAVQVVLKRVRRSLRSALRRAEETISYQIPTYKLEGRAVLYFAGWKQHYSLYPATDALVAKFRRELAAYDVSKGTIRFPLAGPVPEQLIARLARFRAAELSQRGAPAKKAPARTSASAKTAKSATKPRSKAKRKSALPSKSARRSAS